MTVRIAERGDLAILAAAERFPEQRDRHCFVAINLVGRRHALHLQRRGSRMHRTVVPQMVTSEGRAPTTEQPCQSATTLLAVRVRTQGFR
jgi:hypothetical protein